MSPSAMYWPPPGKSQREYSSRLAGLAESSMTSNSSGISEFPEKGDVMAAGPELLGRSCVERQLCAAAPEADEDDPMAAAAAAAVAAAEEDEKMSLNVVPSTWTE